MSQKRNQAAFHYTHSRKSGTISQKQKVPGSDYQKVSAAARRLSKSFEGRELLQAAADLEGDDLRALASFAKAASRGMW